MREVDHIIAALPPYEGKSSMVSPRQDSYDIMREIMRAHKDHRDQYDSIAKQYWKGDAVSTAKYLYQFLKQHVPYREERLYRQTVKPPAGILSDATGDCKHYASFIVGIGDALARLGYPVRFVYRFASYDRGNKSPGHVFAVMIDNGREYWIDPVPQVKAFDRHYPMPVYTTDKAPARSIGALYRMSGISNQDTVGTHRRRPQWSNNQVQQFHPRRGWQPAHPHQAHPEHWLDGMGKGGKGKAKIKNFGKKLKAGIKHIKIQPGKLLKKAGLATPRNAYLLLLKLNVFNLAVKIFKSLKGHPERAKKLDDFWKKWAGNTNKLHTAINQGVGTYNKLHKKHKVAGFDDMAGIDAMDGIDESIGIVQAAGAAAVIAAAAPIIKAISGLLKSFGIAKPHDDDMVADADGKVAEDHNEATDVQGDGNKDITEDGSVDHGNGVKTNVVTHPDGTQSITYDIKDPTTGGGGGSSSGGSSSGGGATDQEEDEDDKTVTKTKTKTVTKTGTGGGFAGMLENVQDFVSEHKMWFIGGGVVLLGIIIIPRFFPKKKPTRKR